MEKSLCPSSAVASRTIKLDRLMQKYVNVVFTFLFSINLLGLVWVFVGFMTAEDYYFQYPIGYSYVFIGGVLPVSGIFIAYTSFLYWTRPSGIQGQAKTNLYLFAVLTCAHILYWLGLGLRA